MSEPVKSPCISVCKLDACNVCIGCWRTLDEIAAWSALNDRQKAAVLEQCALRQRTQLRA